MGTASSTPIIPTKSKDQTKFDPLTEISPGILINNQKLLRRLALGFLRVTSSNSEFEISDLLDDDEVTGEEERIIDMFVQLSLADYSPPTASSLNESSSPLSYKNSYSNNCVSIDTTKYSQADLNLYSNLSMSKTQFQNLMFPPNLVALLPNGLAECIYNALSITVNQSNIQPLPQPTSVLPFRSILVLFSVLLSQSQDLMAALAFKIYDVSRRGQLPRMQVEKFVKAIYTKEVSTSFETRRVLEFMWAEEEDLSMEMFVRKIRESMNKNTKQHHILLQWLERIKYVLIPKEYTNEMCERWMQIPQYNEISSSRILHRLCCQYGLNSQMLFEVKRKFYSLCDGISVNQDSMSNRSGSTNGSSNGNYVERGLMLDSWLEAVACASELGGGFLPIPLAKLVFFAISHQASLRQSYRKTKNSKSIDFRSLSREYLDTSIDVDDDIDYDDDESSYYSEFYREDQRGIWSLHDFIKFGCLSARECELAENGEIYYNSTLYEFIFRMFVGLNEVDDIDQSNVETANLMMTKPNIARMVLLLVGHLKFREIEDNTHSFVNNKMESDRRRDRSMLDGEIHVDETLQIDKNYQIALGLMSEESEDSITLSEAVEIILVESECQGSNGIDFEGFIRWSCKNQGLRIRGILKELSLIGSILVGVKPSIPQLERVFMDEVFRRFKHRNIHSSKCPRGPPGTVHYLIPQSWWNNWKNYSKAGSGDTNYSFPPIQNILLDLNSSALRPNLQHGHDFELIPPMAWGALQAWHDVRPPISRTVVSQNNGFADLELYPFCVNIYLASFQNGKPAPFQRQALISQYQTVGSVCKDLSHQVKDISPERESRLWKILNGVQRRDDFELLQNDKLISESGLSSGSTVMLEIQTEEGAWPHDGRCPNETTVHQIAGTFSSPALNGDGIVGLYNMGNTCYLNSSIQCLSHTPLLRQYFASKAYLNDINQTNPLGQQGKLAQVTATLVCELWKGHASALTPKTFRDALGKFNEQFAGNEQHDAQELLAFLLSGLSEDLNRILDKPYIEQPDSDGRPDTELAEIWWKNHLRREMSIIVALFTGQYKSLLTCGTCGYASARFEPFAFLQVPLPENGLINLTFFLFPVSDAEPISRHSLRVHFSGTLLDALVALSKVLYKDEALQLFGSGDSEYNMRKEEAEKFYKEKANDLAVVHMKDHCIQSMQPQTKKLVDLPEGEALSVYQLDPLPKANILHSEELSNRQSVSVNEKQGDNETKKDDDDSSVSTNDDVSNHDYQNGVTHHPLPTKMSYIALAQRRPDCIKRPFLYPFMLRPFGSPMLLRLELEGMTGRDLYDLVARRMVRFVDPSTLTKSLNTYSDEKKLNLAKISSILTRGVVTDDEYNKSIVDSGRMLCRKQASKNGSNGKVTLDDDNCTSGKIPRYGFRLRLTNRDAWSCSRCEWLNCCVGCDIPDNDAPTIVKDGDTVSIDWHLNSAAFEPHEKNKITDQSHYFNNTNNEGNQVGSSVDDQLTLYDCLDKFALEEEIPEAYCSKCREFRISKKQMSLWRLPPVLIIHLKRFHFTPTSRRKLRDLVVFPTEGFDPSRIVSFEENNGTLGEPTGGVNENEDTTKLSDSSLYDLYGVVHHLGALHGGHYVASLKSEFDGKWRLYNDAQIVEKSAKDIIDPSAYILFYVRRDMKHARLEDVWDTSGRVGEGVTEEEIDKLVRQRDRCVIM